jgi:CO/xanthine dehydrogenase FAD-binding subunit
MNNAHPALPEFDYVKPATLVEASKFLADHPSDARLFLGGTDCFVRMRDGFLPVEYMVDVKSIEGMDAITFDAAKGLTIGAAVPMNRVIAHADIQKHYALLAQAARTVASYQLRTRATIIGNICNASPAGDTLGACILLGGVLTIHGKDGTRQESLEKFFVGPGKTNLKTGDIVTAITFPIPPTSAIGKYLKLGRNTLSDLSLVGVTVYAYPDKDVTSGYRFKLALASVAPIPLVVAKVEEVMAAKTITADTIAEAAQAAMDECTPIDDVRSTAKYRKYMVRNLTRDALTELWKKLSS